MNKQRIKQLNKIQFKVIYIPLILLEKLTCLPKTKRQKLENQSVIKSKKFFFKDLKKDILLL